jgi:hypothetical protein
MHKFSFLTVLWYWKEGNIHVGANLLSCDNVKRGEKSHHKVTKYKGYELKQVFEGVCSRNVNYLEKSNETNG